MSNDIVPSPTDSVIKISPPAEPEVEPKGSYWKILGQIIFPLGASGFAMVLTGMYLHSIQDWDVFLHLNEITVLIPALLGLKGNLEMTLASRLSTEANLGKMADPKELRAMVTGNLCLVQCQAIVVGLLSSITTIILVYLTHDKFVMKHAIIVCACSMATASLASLILGALTAFIILISVCVKVDPDNISTPIAASLGDITSLLLLAKIASSLYSSLGSDLDAETDDNLWVPILIIVTLLLMMPVFIVISFKNAYTEKVLTSGWTPVISAMFISTLAGLALDHFIHSYSIVPAFQPILNGIGGNLVSIQASRLSTALHKTASLGTLPDGVSIFIKPLKIFTSDASHALTSRVLMSLVVPGHLLFGIIIFLVNSKSMLRISFIWFMLLYISAAVIQVVILLYVAYALTNYFWKRGVNPDNSTIPYLTALGDVLGIILLGLVCKILEWLNQGDIVTT